MMVHLAHISTWESASSEVWAVPVRFPSAGVCPACRRPTWASALSHSTHLGPDGPELGDLESHTASNP